MFQLIFLAATLFLAVEGAIAAFWPSWAHRKMIDLQDVSIKTLRFVGLVFVAVGGVLVCITDGILQIACLTVVLEGSLCGFFPVVTKTAMRHCSKASKAVVKVWGETALGIGAAGFAIFL